MFKKIAQYVVEALAPIMVEALTNVIGVIGIDLKKKGADYMDAIAGSVAYLEAQHAELKAQNTRILAILEGIQYEVNESDVVTPTTGGSNGTNPPTPEGEEG